jgi:tRNA (cytidine32/uridine32-2'-O)-methyltransferase
MRESLTGANGAMAASTGEAHLDDRLTRIRFVLVEPTHPGNVGAVARAMKTMGLTRLVLVSPKCALDAEAIARASGADDLLAAASVYRTLPEALAGCRLVVGTSARLRHLDWPQLDPRACGEHLVAEAAAGDAALILGRESSGLSNEELARCHYLARIPTHPGFSSLNLAAAAQVFAYEVYMALRTGALGVAGGPEAGIAPAEALEGLHGHLAQALADLGFSRPEQSHRLLQRLRRLFNRARPDLVEVNILRGILSAAQGRKRSGRSIPPAMDPGHPDDPGLDTLSPPGAGDGGQ